jgi:hypothetical protein
VSIEVNLLVFLFLLVQPNVVSQTKRCFFLYSKGRSSKLEIFDTFKNRQLERIWRHQFDIRTAIPRGGVQMTVGNYPITRINNAIGSFVEHSYKVWCWHIGGSALSCPFEPLTQEFWHEKRNSRLVYGLRFPGIDLRYGGDLIILVTQYLQYAKNKGFGGLTVRQRYELYSLIQEVDFIHVSGLKSKPMPVRFDFFNKCANDFVEHVLPKKNESGELYREPTSKSNEAIVLRLDGQGKIDCPGCKRKVMAGGGLWVLDNQIAGDEMNIVFAICEHCGELVEITLDPNLMKNKVALH